MTYQRMYPLATGGGGVELTTTKASGDLSIITRGPANTFLWIDWGDGSGETVITHTGTGNNITTDHTYGAAAGTKNIVITGFLTDVTRFRCDDTTLGGDVSTFAAFTNLDYIYIYNTLIDGDIASLGGLTSLTACYLHGSDVSGDIANLATLTNLNYLHLNATGVTGDIADLATLSGLLYLHLYSTAVTGDIADINGLTSLQNLRLDSTSVSGDVGDLDTLTSLGELRLNTNSSINGDIGDLSTLISLTRLYLSSTDVDYTTTTLPDWSDIDLQLQSTELQSTSEVDQILIDLNLANVEDATINVGGDNAAVSATSSAARTSLVANGCTLTYNT